MKRLHVITYTIFLALASLSFGAEDEEQPFFYETEGRAFLILLPETVGVRFVDGTTADRVAEFAQAHDSRPVQKHDYGAFYELTTPPDLCPQEFITLLNQEEIVASANPVYSSQDGLKAILVDRFIARFIPETSEADIEAFNAKNRVDIVEKKAIPDYTYYILRVTKDSPLNALWMANFYHEQAFTLWAQPGFLINALATPVEKRPRLLATTWATIKEKPR